MDQVLVLQDRVSATKGVAKYFEVSLQRVVHFTLKTYAGKALILQILMHTSGSLKLPEVICTSIFRLGPGVFRWTAKHKPFTPERKDNLTLPGKAFVCLMSLLT